MALSISRMKVLHVFLVLVMLAITSAVDRGNFKTCDQSGFCKRQRATEPGSSPYRALLNTVTTEHAKLGLDLLNINSKKMLRLELSALESNMARLRIDEKEPTKARYEPPIGDVLVQEPLLDSIEEQSRDSTSMTLTFGKNKVIVQAEPFRIDFIAEGEPVISVNSRALMNFEHYRSKGGKPAEPVEEEDPHHEETEEEQAQAEQAEKQEEEKPEEEKQEEEEPGMWEETFKSHQDTKPHGPSSVGLDFSFPGFEFVYGIPEHADTLALKSTKTTDPYRLYNLDVFEYELDNPMALYGAVPLMLAHNEQRTVGLFWLNAAETWVDISSSVSDKNIMSKLVDFVKGGDDIPQVDTHWFSESGIIDVFFLFGPSPQDVFSQYAKLTGTTPLPPLFGIAYHQSRWNYNDEQDVANVDAGYDEHRIPMDVIWLDIEHTDGKRYFTWDSNKFPTSTDMIDKVAAKGRKMVTIIDPHIKRDDNYKIHKEGRENGYYIKNKDGNDYDGWCWPGSSGWLDFVDPKVREFWANKFQLSEYEGSTMDLFTWNDMNEPSVFNGPEITMHKDAQHFGGWEHRDVHNIYGMYVHRATFEGHLARSEGQERPFVLSRALYAGSQRYGAVWTGDNTAEWGHLKISVPMILSLSLCGITFSGADVGGFFKNPDSELLTRWYQAAAFQPFFRAHAHLDTKRREPWLLPEENMMVIREAIRERYTYLPYWYTLFYLGEKHGGPIAMPLWVEFPKDKNTFALQEEHLVGNALLVHPVTDSRSSGVNIYFPGPGEVWYDTKNYRRYEGGAHNYYSVDLYSIPVFQRGGTIVPRKLRQRRASSLMKNDPFTLIIALDKQGESKGDLYVDDYHSHQYRVGQFLHRRFTYSGGTLTSRSADPSGSFDTKEWLERIVVIGVNTQPNSITLEGPVTQSLEFKYDSSSQVLVIRKPAINIAQDFTISLQ